MRVTIPVLADPQTLRALLVGLVAASERQIREGNLPELYRAGIVYRREPRGVEVWQTARVTARRGLGDCEDLAIYRAAELRVQGIDATAVVMRTRTAGQLHAVVRWPDGAIEDPSRIALALERRRKEADHGNPAAH